MTQLITRDRLTRIATVGNSPALAAQNEQATVRNAIDRAFELPTALYGMTIAAYLAAIAVMASAFMNAEMVLPAIIFVVVIVGIFGVPAKWVRMDPANRQQPMSYATFKRRGIDTASGHLTSIEAMVQVLILPVLILCWALTIAVIASFT